ncbi:hypothetical protein HN011_007167 [Eciton burchellii]|nr:hypothetical protein HN011_007167 [Eciton burchellii]
MVKNRRQADPKHHSAHWSKRSGNHFRDGIDNRESDVGDPSGGHPVRSQALIDRSGCLQIEALELHWDSPLDRDKSRSGREEEEELAQLRDRVSRVRVASAMRNLVKKRREKNSRV